MTLLIDEGIADRERNSLCDAIHELLAAPMTRDKLDAEVREHWGACTDQQIAMALRLLVRGGSVRRSGGEYARVEAA